MHDEINFSEEAEEMHARAHELSYSEQCFADRCDLAREVAENPNDWRDPGEIRMGA